MYIFTHYPKYFIAIRPFSSPSMLSCFASTHIYLDTHFCVIVFLPLRLRTFAAKYTPGIPYYCSILPLPRFFSYFFNLLILLSLLPLFSFLCPPLLLFYLSAITFPLLCLSLLSFLSFSNLTPKPSFSSLIPKNQLYTTYLLLLFLYDHVQVNIYLFDISYCFEI